MILFRRFWKRDSVDFDWAEEYRDEAGWRTVRNPELDATRHQKIARVVLGLVLLSLPLSVLALLVGAFTLAMVQRVEDEPEPVAYEHPWEAVGHAQAEQGVRVWLDGSGRDVAWVRSLSADRSNLDCGAARCEQHSVAAYLADGSVLIVGALVRPADGTLMANPYLLAWDPPLAEDRDVQPVEPGESLRTTWSAMGPRTEFPNASAVEAVVEEWAAHWVAGDQEFLQRISGDAQVQEFWTPPSGFDYVVGSAKIIDWGELPDSGGERVATVSLEVLPADLSGCVPAYAAEIAGDQEVCPESLLVSADIRLVAAENQTVRVLGSSPTGSGGRQFPSDVPRVGDDVWRGTAAR